MVQRLLIFEEPVSRLSRIRRMLVRHNRSKFKAKFKGVPIAQMPQSAQRRLFNNIFGRANADLKNMLLSFTLAEQDLKRFTRHAFENFHAGYQRGQAPRDAKTVVEPRFLTLFQNTMEQYTTAEQEWLIHSLAAVPDWSMLKTHGPWSTDPRALFLMDCYDSFEHVITEHGNRCHIELYDKIRTHFCLKLKDWRQKLPGGFLPHCILLVEGRSEALLIPHLGAMMGKSFDALGIRVVPAGGANQVVRQYLSLKDVTVLPIVCVLDRDALDQASLLKNHLLHKDRLYIMKEGELEDIFETKTLKRLIRLYSNSLGSEALNPDLDNILYGERSNMDRINQAWRLNGLGHFNKVHFAKFLINHLLPEELPEEAGTIIKIVLEVTHEL